MNEQEMLLEAAEDDIDAAKYLLKGSKYDQTISRSYYAVFNAAKDLLIEKNSKPKTHQGVSTEL